jgi:hypothetical protein
MRWMITTIFSPYGLMILGAVIVAVGGIVAAIGVVWNEKNTEITSNKQTLLLQDVAARAGDKTQMEELIRTRARALYADRRQADNVAEDVIKRLPELTAEFQDFQRDIRDAQQRENDEFRLNWEPFVRTTVEKFDSVIEQFRHQGVKMEVARNDNLSLTSEYFQSTPELRTVSFEGTQIRLFYSSYVADERNHRDASIYFAGGNMNITVTLGLQHASCKTEFFETNKIDTQATEVSKDSGVSKTFVDFVDGSIAKIFERAVVITRAEKEKR